MKLFFLNKLSYFTFFVFALSLFSQLIIFLNKNIPADASVSLNTQYVYLGIDEGDFKGVELYLNGEKEAEFTSALLKAHIPKNAVIEIYNPGDNNITVILNSPYTVMECKKGFNYVIRLK